MLCIKIDLFKHCTVSPGEEFYKWMTRFGLEGRVEGFVSFSGAGGVWGVECRPFSLHLEPRGSAAAQAARFKGSSVHR